MAGPKTFDVSEADLLAEAKARGLDTSEFEGPTARAPAEAPYEPMTPGSDARVRLDLGLGPAVNAQQTLYQTEGWHPGTDKPQGHNPLTNHPIAAALGGMEGGKIAEWTGLHPSWLGKAVGGQEYQNYDQASKSFESAFLPILSGAAVTPTEAQRMIRANLPEPLDSPHTLAMKASNRAMMINAAADLAGRPRPFPKIGTMNLKDAAARAAVYGGQVAPPGGQTAQPAAAPAAHPTIQPGQVYKGHTFLGGDPSKRESWR